MGLTWKARGGERSTFDGRDASGRFYAHATNISGPWTIYLAPWACGREGVLTTGPYEDATEAMAAAERIVAEHVDGTVVANPDFPQPCADARSSHGCA